MKKIIPLKIKLFLKNFLNGVHRKSFLWFFNIYNENLVDDSLLDLFFQGLNPIKTEHNLIRIGDESDGGYLLPNDLEGINFCFSPGVSDNSNFEKELHDNFNIKSFLCDYSVNGPAIKCDGFSFEKKYLASFNYDNYFTLEKWMNKCKYSGDLLLQMDIESYEYQVLIETNINILKRFRILLIEFHNFDSIFSQSGYMMIKGVFDKLKEEFDIVHIHPNNYGRVFSKKKYKIPEVMEFTFLRKDRSKIKINNVSFPHKLDIKNNKYSKEIYLDNKLFNHKI